MNVKAAWPWLDRLTAWGFIVGLCCWSYHIFMIQSPARFPNFGRGEALGDLMGVLQVMTPYIVCVVLGAGTRGMLSGWPGSRVCWKMLIWMHTRLLVPTLLSYFAAYTLYDNAEQLVNTSLSFNMMFSFAVDAFVFFCYFFSADNYNQHQSTE